MQLFEYGVTMLDKLPVSYRTSVVQFITDLHRIQLFRTTRRQDGTYVMDGISQEYDDVLSVLSAMLLAKPLEVG